MPRSKEARSAAKTGVLQSFDLKGALQFLEKTPKELLHVQIVEEEAFFRISEYGVLRHSTSVFYGHPLI